MAQPSEIEKLERRCKENPQGTFFAPLAEAYRKDQQLDRALEVLKSGLERHPNHIPGNIVLGRCHLDLGDDVAAETTFHRVLELDRENVIGLKALADITERHLRYGESERWVQQLLEVDRSNEEARAQLMRVQTLLEQSAASPLVIEDAAEQPQGSEPFAPEEVGAASSEEETDEGALTAVGVPEVEEEPASRPAAAQVTGLESMEHDAAEAGSSNTEALVDLETTQEATAGDEQVAPLAGLDEREFHAVVIAEATHELGVEPDGDIVLTSSAASEYQVPSDAEALSRSSAASEFQTPSDSETLGRSQAEDVPPLQDSISTETESSFVPSSSPTEEPLLDEPAPVGEPIQAEPTSKPGADRAEPTRGEPEIGVREPELVVTETMAELYVQQGHRREALRVYRELADRGAADPRLREIIAELERGEKEAAREARAQAEREAGVNARSAFVAEQTGGKSVEDFFRALIAARPLPAAVPPASGRAQGESPAPGMEPEAAGRAVEPLAAQFEEEGLAEALGDEPQAPPGAPTRPASDHLSLSAIFGEDSSPVPPVVSPGGGAEAARHGGPSASSTFDEFFGGTDPGVARGGHPGVVAGRARSDEEDLEQFHNWLKGLKR